MGANSAHSCRVGFVFLAEAEPQCSRISNAIAHHTTEVGIVYDRSGTNIEVEHVLLSDNRIGLAIMPGTRRDTGHLNISRTAAIGYSNNGGVVFISNVASQSVLARNERAGLLKELMGCLVCTCWCWTRRTGIRVICISVQCQELSHKCSTFLQAVDLMTA